MCSIKCIQHIGIEERLLFELWTKAKNWKRDGQVYTVTVSNEKWKMKSYEVSDWVSETGTERKERHIVEMCNVEWKKIENLFLTAFELWWWFFHFHFVSLLNFCCFVHSFFFHPSHFILPLLQTSTNFFCCCHFSKGN
jgi:hypothetical protein